MKKRLIALSLIFLISAAVLSGSLALYTTTLDALAEGSVTAKEFVFTGSGTDSFRHGVKIAPSETVRWTFSVRNFDGALTTETDLYYKLTVRVAATAGKSAIEPLVVTVRDGNGAAIGSVTGTGYVELLGAFPVYLLEQEDFYAIECVWPSDGENDIAYAGGAFGSTVTIDAIASQSPLSLSPQNPEEPQEPVSGSVTVRYATTEPWTNSQSGIYQFEFQVTITNNGDKPIEDWFMFFTLPTDRVTRIFGNAKLGAEGPDGTYRIDNPRYNNVKTDSIRPGESVTFGGHAVGMGAEPITGIRIGGSNVAETADVVLETALGAGVHE